jgi:hypothetical protein
MAEGRAILFLGAGASYGACSADGKKSALTGKQLGEALSDKFLGGRRKAENLARIADYAISEGGLGAVQDFIREQFETINPLPFHLLIPRFRWKAIVTTNYDRVVEKAYESVKERLQNPVPVVRNGDWRRVSENPRAVPIIKLHGCVSHASDTGLPFVIANEQYLKYRIGRERLSTTFADMAKDYPVLFCGYAISDPHVQAIAFGLEDGTVSRPQYLAIDPRFDDLDLRHWASHRITAVSSTFERFLTQLDQEIPQHKRMLGSLFADSLGSLSAKVSVGKQPSRMLQALVAGRLTHIHDKLIAEAPKPERFYRGDSRTWAPIKAGLDFSRAVVADLVSSLASHVNGSGGPKVVVLSGHAGSGKSVAIRRAAWQLSSSPFSRLVLFAESGIGDAAEGLIELCAITNERVFVFVDNLLYEPEAVSDAFRLGKV